MIEAAVTIAIAAVSALGVAFSKVHNKTSELDRRIDAFELRVAETYVPREELVFGYQRIEDRMVRIEEKLDKILLSQ